jgi:chondroitin AC lyase
VRWVAGVVLVAAALARAADADDLATIRARFIASILPTDNSARSQILREALRHAGSMKADGSWVDIDYSDQARSLWHPRDHLQRLLVMAKAVRLAHDEALKRKTLAGVDFWLAHDLRNPNWWWNEIGAPQLLGETSLVMKEDLSEAQRKSVIQIMSRGVWKKWTGQNLVWGVTNQIVRGCLEESEELVAEGYQRLYDEIRIVPAALEGIQADYSFHQHGPQFYSGGYGQAFAQDTARFTSFAWDTKFQISPDKLDVLEHYLLDGEAWMIRGDTFDHSATGREITRKGKAAVTHSWTSGPVTPPGAAYTMATAVHLLSSHELPRKAELDAFASRLRGDATSVELVGNKHFWDSDYMSHRRAGYFASVRMFSDRLLNTETINDEGRKSQHLADGCCLIYRSGYEYRNIFPVWDWTKIPGTTAEQGTLDVEPHAIGTRGKTSFVGGASDGTCGMAAMDLERGKLKAHKAWMFFDDAIVCLGAGIGCTSENPVVTSVNQCRFNGAVTKGSAGDVRWFHHDGVGYVVPSGADVHLTTGKQTGSWAEIGTGSAEVLSEPVFNLWIDHGTHALGGMYAYIVLPDNSAAATEQRAGKLDVEILSNTPEIQAVRHSGSDRTMIAFFAAGKLDLGEGHSVSVDRPCLVMIHREAQGAKVTVSNPCNRALVVKVRLDKTDATFDLPGGEMAGASVARRIP